MIFSCSQNNKRIGSFVEFSCQRRGHFFDERQTTTNRSSAGPTCGVLFLCMVGPSGTYLSGRLLGETKVKGRTRTESSLEGILIRELPRLTRESPFTGGERGSERNVCHQFRMIPYGSCVHPLRLVLSLREGPRERE